MELDISFPTSDQDHRLQLVAVNGKLFALILAPLVSDGPIRLECEDWSLILLAPIRSEEEVVIRGIDVVCLNEVVGKAVAIQADNLMISFNQGVKGKLWWHEDKELHLKVFQGLTKVISNKSVEGQREFILALAQIAAKIAGEGETIDLASVLRIWGIK